MSLPPPRQVVTRITPTVWWVEEQCTRVTMPRGHCCSTTPDTPTKPREQPMAGAYCKFCDHRCFVYRIIPEGELAGFGFHLATCPDGMAHDREKLGYDHTTAINPMKENMS